MRRGISQPPEENPATPVRTCGCAVVFVRAQSKPPCAGRTGFAKNSSLEGTGFERWSLSRNWCRSRSPDDRGSMPHVSERPLFPRRDLGFESGFLQGRVACEPEDDNLLQAERSSAKTNGKNGSNRPRKGWVVDMPRPGLRHRPQSPVTPEGNALRTGRDFIAALRRAGLGSGRSSVPQLPSLRAIHSPPAADRRALGVVGDSQHRCGLGLAAQ